MCVFKASLGYTVKLSQKNENKRERRRRKKKKGRMNRYVDDRRQIDERKEG